MLCATKCWAVSSVLQQRECYDVHMITQDKIGIGINH